MLLSAGIGLLWGLRCGYKKGGLADRLSTATLIVFNAVPTFLIGLGLMIVFCFQNRLLPYTGLNSPETVRGTVGYVWDRVLHLLLPVGTLTLAALPSRYLLVRNMAASASDGKDILYAKQRGLPDSVIRRDYLLRSIAQPFLTTEAVYTLDYPLMQGILFVTTCIMVLSILLTDFLCLLLDPKRKLEGRT